jgi:hypothetical protein
MAYTHRNGETEPPTQQGMFGFRPSSNSEGWIVDVVEVNGRLERIMSYSDDETMPIDEFDGQWWGPITGPWDSANEGDNGN